MRFLAALLAAIHVLLLPSLASAQTHGGSRAVVTERWVEEWDPVAQRWVRVAEEPAEHRTRPRAAVTNSFSVNGVAVPASSQAARYARPTLGLPVAEYGPFRVLDDRRAAIVGPTDRMSPAWFDAMLSAHPGLEVLEMIEAPGTEHDIANLAVGRRIREAGLRTHVPRGGSVRSGAVELFLAGTTKSMEDGAEFAVHSWLDMKGREPDDFAEDHPANRLYLDYYVEMGMSEARAREFYAMTNSVPHHSALWLGAAEMRAWVKPERQAIPAHRVVEAGPAPLPVVGILDRPVELPFLDGALDVQLAEVDPVHGAPAIQYADITATSLARLDVDLLDS